jgi:hypothetical protein
VQRLGAARVVQAIVFHSASSLHRWCDADVARFDYGTTARARAMAAMV